MRLHRPHIDGGEQVIDECNVFASELATIHHAAHWLETKIAIPYPPVQRRFRGARPRAG